MERITKRIERKSNYKTYSRWPLWVRLEPIAYGADGIEVYGWRAETAQDAVAKWANGMNRRETDISVEIVDEHTIRLRAKAPGWEVEETRVARHPDVLKARHNRTECEGFDIETGESTLTDNKPARRQRYGDADSWTEVVAD